MAVDRTARAGLPDRAWTFWSLLAVATGLGAFLRLHGLDRPSFWVDEFFTIGRVGTDELHWTNALGYLPTRLSLWLHGADLGAISLATISDWPALGVSERGARLGAAWVGVLSVPVLGLLARPVFGGGAAGAAALLLAILPWHLYWSQMARFYTTQFLFANVFVLLLARGLVSGRRLHLALAGAAGVLAYLSHPTALLVVAACIAPLALAWLARVAPPRLAAVVRLPFPHLVAGLVTLAALSGACLLLLLLKEFDPSVSGSLGQFSGQSWDPSLPTLLLGTVLRLEPVIFAAGIAWVVVALRRRDPTAILVGSVAVLVPLAVLLLKPIFPVGPRYYFPCLFAWILLAALWAAEVERRLRDGAGAAVAAAGLAVLLVAVGFNSYLYARDGAGGRARWREAYAYVRQHGEPGVPVFVGAGKMQALFYLGRPVSPFPQTPQEIASLPPGAWLVHRTRGGGPGPSPELPEVRARFEIPSKPWSWVVLVMQVPAS